MPDAPDRRPPLGPSHIAWPAFVVFLLVLSISMAGVTFLAARSDGGARPTEAAEVREHPAEPPAVTPDSVTDAAVADADTVAATR